MKTAYRNLVIYALLTLAIFILYNGFQNNYYYSDDFQWISHAVLIDDSLSEAFLVRGRDFNPLLTIFFWVVIKAGGLSPLMLRILCFFTFTGALFTFYYILYRYFNINPVIAFYAVLMVGFNVYISEVLLYISTFVYALTLLLFFIALKFYLDGKKILYLVFMLLAFQVKETIILMAIPLFLYENKKNNRLFLAVITPLIFLTRFIFQVGSTGSYTNFANLDNLYYKLYFLILHPMNLSPFAMNLSLGIGVILIVSIIFIYYLDADRRAVFFISFFAVYVLFFAFLPKISSKYYFYSSFAFWGGAALLGNFFHKKSRYAKYFILPLLFISLFFNYPAVKKEIEDYRILGDFSKTLIEEQKEIIKSQVNLDNQPVKLKIERVGDGQLRRVYQNIYSRNTLLKLLPVRAHSVGGVLLPGDLIPFIFYPEKIVRWKQIKETPGYFSGELEPSTRN
jgi:hypothetical protein